MRPLSHTPRRATFALLLATAVSAPGAAQLGTSIQYRLVKPASLPGARSSRALAVCGDRFVGESNGVQSEDGYPLATSWSEPGSPQSIGGIGVSVSFASDVNSRGQIVGLADFVDGLPDPFAVAFVWESGVHRALPDLTATGFPFSFPNAIDERGNVVGVSTAPSGLHAVLWRGAHVLDLGTLGGPTSEAHDLDELGRIVGGAYRADGRRVAVMWVPRKDGGAVAPADPEYRCVQLVDLGGPFASATGINAHGQVVGSATIVGSNDARPFLWQSGSAIGLTTLALPARANAIEDSGTIVGASGTRAVLWRAGEPGIVDLNDVTAGLAGWTLREAFDVDESGRIVGRAIDAQGTPRAFLLEPL